MRPRPIVEPGRLTEYVFAEPITSAPARLTLPLTVRLLAVTSPVDRVKDDTAPAVLTLLARSKPVKLPVLATSAPGPDTVPAAEPTVTVEALLPIRIVPPVAPVPASRTRSPPAKPVSPA